MSTPILTPTASAWVEQAFPDKNHAGEPAINLDGSGSVGRRGFMYLGQPVLLGSAINSALLKLFTSAAWAGGPWTITAKRVTAPWTANLLTWNNQPAVDATHSASAVVSGLALNAEIDLDLAPMLTDAAGGAPLYGIRLETSPAGPLSLVSPQAAAMADYRPELDLDFGFPPEPPTNLNLISDAVTALALPTLAWDFGSQGDDDPRSQAYCQVQIATDALMASIEYDSGKVANTLSQYDLSAPPAGAPLYLVTLGTVTITIASPGVLTFNSHGLLDGDPFQLTTTGSLPTGLSPNTTYYASAPTTNTFKAAATPGGAAINTSGTQSGTHTLKRMGIPDGAVRYWRVQCWDDKGLASGYSQVA